MLEDCKGYKELYECVERDCKEKDGIVHPNGCDSNCIAFGKCFHKYCDKFKWILDRAKYYADKLGLNAEDVLTAWEKDRSYWYMNYYQESNQPNIESDTVRVFDTIQDFMDDLGDTKFRCPSCGKESSNPYECSECDWKVYGLLRGLGKTSYVYVKEELRGEEIFTPIKWEKSNEKDSK